MKVGTISRTHTPMHKTLALSTSRAVESATSDRPVTIAFPRATSAPFAIDRRRRCASRACAACRGWTARPPQRTPARHFLHTRAGRDAWELFIPIIAAAGASRSLDGLQPARASSAVCMRVSRAPTADIDPCDGVCFDHLSAESLDFFACGFRTWSSWAIDVSPVPSISSRPRWHMRDYGTNACAGAMHYGASQTQLDKLARGCRT
jgi:hypothetical protein